MAARRIQIRVCGKKLTQSSDEYYHGSHVDHIVPDAGDDLLNLALACRTCNFIKHKTPFIDGEVWAQTDPAVRAAIILRAAVYIASIRERNDNRLAEDLRLLRLLDEKPVLPL